MPAAYGFGNYGADTAFSSSICARLQAHPWHTWESQAVYVLVSQQDITTTWHPEGSVWTSSSFFFPFPCAMPSWMLCCWFSPQYGCVEKCQSPWELEPSERHWVFVADPYNRLVLDSQGGLDSQRMVIIKQSHSTWLAFSACDSFLVLWHRRRVLTRNWKNGLLDLRLSHCTISSRISL